MRNFIDRIFLPLIIIMVMITGCGKEQVESKSLSIEDIVVTEVGSNRVGSQIKLELNNPTQIDLELPEGVEGVDVSSSSGIEIVQEAGVYTIVSSQVGQGSITFDIMYGAVEESYKTMLYTITTETISNQVGISLKTVPQAVHSDGTKLASYVDNLVTMDVGASIAIPIESLNTPDEITLATNNENISAVVEEDTLQINGLVAGNSKLEITAVAEDYEPTILTVDVQVIAAPATIAINSPIGEQIESITIEQGETLNLQVGYEPVGATVGGAFDEDIFSAELVNNQLTVTGVNIGTGQLILTAEAEGYSQGRVEVMVEVTPTKLPLSLSASRVDLTLNNSKTVNVDTLKGTTTTLEVNSDVFTAELVGNTITITPIKTGSGTITVKTTAEGYYDNSSEIAVSVGESPIILTATSQNITANVGSSTQVTLTANPSNVSYDYSSLNGTLQINHTGNQLLITPTVAGTDALIITATANGYTTAQIRIDVTANTPALNLSLTDNSVNISPDGEVWVGLTTDPNVTLDVKSSSNDIYAEIVGSDIYLYAYTSGAGKTATVTVTATKADYASVSKTIQVQVDKAQATPTPTPTPAPTTQPVATPTPEANTGSGSTTTLNPNSFEAQVVELVNEERAREGLSPLSSGNGLLHDAAEIRAKETEELFSHSRPDGSDWSTVVDELGIDYYTIGENLAMGQTSPEQVVEEWMNSPGHRENIMRDSFTQIGVHVYQKNGIYYWCQIFKG